MCCNFALSILEILWWRYSWRLYLYLAVFTTYWQCCQFAENLNASISDSPLTASTMNTTTPTPMPTTTPGNNTAVQPTPKTHTHTCHFLLIIYLSINISSEYKYHNPVILFSPQWRTTESVSTHQFQRKSSSSCDHNIALFTRYMKTFLYR